MQDLRRYQYRRILNNGEILMDGDYLIDDYLIIRVKNGFLNDSVDMDGQVHPAVESVDATHIEHWNNGVLHCETEPAVIDNIDLYEEWWVNGVLAPDQISE